MSEATNAVPPVGALVAIVTGSALTIGRAIALPDSLLGRGGQPGEAAAMVRFRCSPEARYVTGQTIHVNGGVFMP
jgi:hypothetical protein